MAPVAASGGLLLLLLIGACGKPSANPEPVVIPTISSSASATPTSIPAVAHISVQPTTTTLAPTVAATTEPPPPPPPPPVQVQPVPEPTTQPPTTEAPEYDEVAVEGFPCDEQGARAVDPAGRKLVCKQTRRGWLIWDRV